MDRNIGKKDKIIVLYRAADEGKCRFLSQNPALRLSGRTGFPHG